MQATTIISKEWFTTEELDEIKMREVEQPSIEKMQGQTAIMEVTPPNDSDNI